MLLKNRAVVVGMEAGIQNDRVGLRGGAQGGAQGLGPRGGAHQESTRGDATTKNPPGIEILQPIFKFSTDITGIRATRYLPKF